MLRTQYAHSTINGNSKKYFNMLFTHPICCPVHTEMMLNSVPKVNTIIYCDMLQFWLISQWHEDKPVVVFQHDGVPPHIQNEATTFLNKQLPEWWLRQWESSCDLPWLLPVGPCVKDEISILSTRQCLKPYITWQNDSEQHVK